MWRLYNAAIKSLQVFPHVASVLCLPAFQGTAACGSIEHLESHAPPWSCVKHVQCGTKTPSVSLPWSARLCLREVKCPMRKDQWRATWADLDFPSGEQKGALCPPLQMLDAYTAAHGRRFFSSAGWSLATQLPILPAKIFLSGAPARSHHLLATWACVCLPPWWFWHSVDEAHLPLQSSCLSCRRPWVPNQCCQISGIRSGQTYGCSCKGSLPVGTDLWSHLVEVMSKEVNMPKCRRHITEL